MLEAIVVKLSMYIVAPGPISTAHVINATRKSERPDSSSVDMLPRQGMKATIEELLDASFSMLFECYQRKAGD
jgi:hypothetical protein